MKRFLKLFWIEGKLGFRSGDMLIFGMLMPVGILMLITMVAGGKDAGSGYTYLDSAFASLIAVGICACSFMGIPLTLADYRDKKILKHFFTTPRSPLWIMGAVVGSGVVMAIISALAVTLVAVIFFDYRMQGSIPAFVGSWVLTLVAMLSIGMLMASLCRTVKSANGVTSLVYFPMLFLSGATIPFELFPDKMQTIASILPLTQGIKLMKATALGSSVDSVMGIVVLLLAITVVCSVISVKTFRWE